jgi:hypothetical protein
MVKLKKVQFNGLLAAIYLVLLLACVTIFWKTYSEFVTDTHIWDGTTGTSYAGGNGTQASPYLISNGKELAYFRDQVDGGSTYAGSYFQLTNDIDLNGKTWDPIGTYATSFRGTFDGAGHIISNVLISTASTLPTSGITSYGFFASLGGGSSYAIVKNLVFDNVSVTVNYNGSTSTNTTTAKGFHIGTVAGTMFAYSNVSNVIVKNSSITQNSDIYMRSYAFQYYVGGLAGYAVNSSSSNGDPGASARYIINNCAVETNITTTTSVQYSWRNGYYYYNYSQHAVGFIIGAVRGQPQAPTNSLYQGSINTSGFAGPLFGYIRATGNNPSTSTTNFVTLFEGNAAGNLGTITSSYTGYSVNDTPFYETGTVGTSLMENVEGVNQGNYITSASNMLDSFNNNTLDGFVWTYTNGDFAMNSRLTGSIDENPTGTYNLTINDNYNTGTYTSTWYVNGTETTATNNSLVVTPSLTEDKVVKIITYDGTYYGVTKITIPKLELHFNFTYDATNHTLTATYAGTGLAYFDTSTFNTTWTYDDISGYDHEQIASNTLQISTSGYDDGADFTITATNGDYTFSSSYSIGNRIVVYVDYYNGSNYNTCLTPDDPCETMAGAYGKLSSTNSRNTNIIVVMNNYYSGSYFNSANNTTYAKKATITSVYKGNNYNGVLYFEGYNNGYKYLNADTTFQYITLTGSTGYNTSQVYFYLQGYNLTMGEGVKMTNYSTSNTNQGLITGNAPAFHIFGGWLQYDYSTLPRNNQKIIIKSGTYGRIIMGGSNGTASTDTMYQYTSHNFLGSNLTDDMFTSTLDVDIKNSTTPTTYTYDINLVVGGSAWGNMYANMTENIKNGNIGRVLGASIGDSSYMLDNWNYPLNTYLGYSTINISGGTVKELYGGALGRNMMALQGESTELCDSYFYGTVNINLTGGTVNGNIYGAGAGGVSGYSTNSSDPYKSYGQNISTNVNITMTGGTVNGNIYGGGYGYTEYLTAGTINTDGGTLYGTSHLNLSGGTINGSVYGAGKGYTSFSSRTKLAQMEGNSNITLSGTSITGNVYGAAEGAQGYNDNAKMTGNPTIDIAQNLTTNVFGGGNNAILVGNPKININSGNITGTVYGGGNVGNVTGESTIYINGGTSNEVYGGGYSADITTTNVKLEGGTVTSMYGGSNTSGNVTKANILTTSGTATNVYGGNNQGGNTASTDLVINGGTLTAVYGGGNATSTTDSTLHLKSSTNKVPNIFAGGNAAAVTTTVTYIEGINAENIFGGSNSSGTVTTSTININSGTADYVYGGNNVGGTTSTSYIYSNGGTIQNVFGGGKSTDAGTTNVVLQGGTVVNTFGGSNTTGTVNESNVTVTGGTLTNIYGGNNEGGTTTTSHVTFSGANISGSIYGGGYSATTTNTNVTITNTWNNLSYVFGGGKSADAGTTNVTMNNGYVNYLFGGSNTNGTVTESNVTTHNGTVINVFGGNNQGGTTTTSHVNIEGATITNVYGGNNEGGTTGSSNVNITAGNVYNAYGGGNAAITGTTSITVNGATINSVVYGGGNQAGVTNGTDVNIINASINGNVFGGGNAGSVGTGTDVYINNSLITDSVYAGGNGASAVVYASTLLNIDSGSRITNSVFGGGNAAVTGTADANNGSSTVNIVGATIGKNVYGGANTSVVYGATYVNIGYSAVNNSGLTMGNINIGGTVFGGGEANAEGSENYDFSFISVTGGTNININASGHSTYVISGSIFGSGNASSSTGASIVNIKNYGTFDNYKTNVSIQRASTVTIDNSAILLTGATDRTNEYSSVLFSVSRVDHLKLKNNSTLFFKNGTNLVKKYTSAYDDNGTEKKATVTINTDNNTTTKTTDNRIYAYQGKNLNIATNENITAYGEVNGMTFFGLFTLKTNGDVETALYNKSYDNNSTVTSGDLYYFTSGSYVLGAHKANHDITVDGFYSNYGNADDTTKIKQNYIAPTPDIASYYMWFIGEHVNTYDITLTASKFSTLGTYELPLLNYSNPNTTFTIVGFNYSDLANGVSLVESNTIPRVAATTTAADNTYGLSIKNGANGWLSNATTNFYSRETNSITGDTDFRHENSTVVPSFVFYLYHSKNISTSGDMGTVVISLIAVTPIDDLNNKVERININVTLNRALYATNEYEGTIAPGKQYELFASSAVNITSTSTFSAYYSLFAESQNTIYRAGYHHVLVSTYVLPVNTKITMVDLSNSTNPEYYYYIVTATDVTRATTEFNTYGEATYELGNFTKMGSQDTTNNYDEVSHASRYYDEDTNYAQEEFIFMVDFAESNITSDVSARLTFELRDAGNQTIINVLGAIISSLNYNLYYNRDAHIAINAALSKTTLYGGDSTNVNVKTIFTQSVINTNTVVDTKFSDQKLGLKLSIYDANGTKLNGTSVMGLSYTFNGVTYYPNIDGSVRINISNRVANVSSKIVMHLNSNAMASGNYTLKIESFGSPDGIYYGLTASDEADLPFTVVDMLYGLKAETAEANTVIDHTTGFNLDGVNALKYVIYYSSNLTNPSITMELQRRKYDDVYSLDYEQVNLADYCTNTFTGTVFNNEYLLSNLPDVSMSQFLYLKSSLKTGTYRLYFKLYDGQTLVGTVYKYIIIK